MALLIIESDVILGFYLSILGDDIFRTLEHIESNQSYHTTLIFMNTIIVVFQRKLIKSLEIQNVVCQLCTFKIKNLKLRNETPFWKVL